MFKDTAMTGLRKNEISGLDKDTWERTYTAHTEKLDMHRGQKPWQAACMDDQDDLEADCMTYLEANGYSPEKIESKKAIELNNGRAAQMGILALMVHEKLDNNPYIINDLLGAPVPFNQ